MQGVLIGEYGMAIAPLLLFALQQLCTDVDGHRDRHRRSTVMTMWIVVFLVAAIVVIAFMVVRGGKSSAATTLRLNR